MIARYRYWIWRWHYWRLHRAAMARVAHHRIIDHIEMKWYPEMVERIHRDREAANG